MKQSNEELQIPDALKLRLQRYCNVSVDLLTNLNYISFLMKMESRQQEAMVSLPGYIQILGWGDRFLQSYLHQWDQWTYVVENNKQFLDVQPLHPQAELCGFFYQANAAKNEQKYLALKNRLCEMRLESELLLKLKRTVTFNEELKAKHVIVFAVMMPVSQD
ncbi:unnamed protein product [Linum tenue]|uniref:Uncharacterized protein n=1 Tax=Linum tenue TaxID=586396 RepID=A0AAV0JVT0_9ROSI|nr:unnamed protein product [Linum tenue]